MYFTMLHKYLGRENFNITFNTCYSVYNILEQHDIRVIEFPSHIQTDNIQLNSIENKILVLNLKSFTWP